MALYKVRTGTEHGTKTVKEFDNYFNAFNYAHISASDLFDNEVYDFV